MQHIFAILKTSVFDLKYIRKKQLIYFHEQKFTNYFRKGIFSILCNELSLKFFISPFRHLISRIRTETNTAKNAAKLNTEDTFLFRESFLNKVFFLDGPKSRFMYIHTASHT